VINIKHITVAACEICGAAPSEESVDSTGGIQYERRRFACGRTIRWSQDRRNAWDSPCPKSPEVVALRALRVRAIKTLLSTLTKLELSNDDAAALAERIKTVWFEIKEADLR